MIKNNYFNDHLNLLDYNFSKYKYIIFTWNSWSWKSTYINKLLLKNNSFDKNIVVIDEIYDIKDFIKLFINLFKNKQFIIASHISINYFYIFKFSWKIKNLNTDKNTDKIYHYLDYKKITYTKIKVKEFVYKYTATYTDIDIILENYSWNNFDEAFNYFIKFNKLELSWSKNI